METRFLVAHRGVKPAETTGRKANEFPILCIIKISSEPSQRYPVFASRASNVQSVTFKWENNGILQTTVAKEFFIYSFIDTFDIKYKGKWKILS